MKKIFITVAMQALMLSSILFVGCDKDNDTTTPPKTAPAVNDPYAGVDWYYYSDNGQKQFYDNLMGYLVELYSSVTSAQREKIQQQILQSFNLDESAILDNNLLFIPITNGVYATVVGILGADTAIAHYCPWFINSNSQRCWLNNSFAMKVEEGADPETILTTAGIPYTRCEQIGSDEDQYTVYLGSFVDHSVQYANAMCDEAQVVWAYPNNNWELKDM